MRALKVLLTALFVLSSLAFSPPEAAFAADPPSAPMTVRASYGFETAYPSDWKVAKHPYPLAGTSSSFIWGRETQSKRTGGYGLWCAGAYASSGAYSYYYPNYPKDTAGRATLTLDQLDEYYSAELQFWWKMPTRGAADGTGFSLNWGPLGTTVDNNPSQWSGYAYFPTSTTWQMATFDLTELSLSRRDGELQFNFRNWIEGGSQFPAQGEGPTIDDVVIYGYKYGPVRDLTAAEGASGVTLNWNRPYRAIGSTTVEERTIAYRVWRRLADQPAGPWTEVTATRVTDVGTAVEYVDTTAAAGVAYTYRVLAYDTDTGSGYGKSTECTVDPSPTKIAVTGSVNPATILAGNSTTFTYRVQNTGSVTLSALTLTDSFGAISSGIPASLAPGAFFETTRVTSPAASMTNHVEAQGTGGGVTRTSMTDISVTVVPPATPGMSLSVSPAERGALSGEYAEYRVAVQNTGTVPLTAVSASGNVVGGSEVANASIGSLAVGEIKYATLQVLVTGSAGAKLTVNFSAAYTYMTTNGTATANASAYVMSDRVFGTDRTDTAIKASKSAFPVNGSADSVIIATGFGFPDALSAAGLAGAGNGPLLLVDGKSSTLSAAVKSEITRLGPSKVYIVGGTSVVSKGIESELSSLAGSAGFTLKPRLAGTNRYHTAQLVAQEVKTLGGNVGTVFLATGLNFPDALAASSLAASMGSPILLTEKDALPSQTDASLRALRPSRVVVCGGTGAVSSGVSSAISGKAVYGSPVVVRVAGDNRYHTGQLIAEWGASASGGNLAPDGIDGVYLATGENYPDALAGGVLAGIGGPQWRPLVLTMGQSLVPQAKSVITGNPTIGFVTAVGGEGVLSTAVVNAAKNLL